jgi:hypothetical protein
MEILFVFIFSILFIICFHWMRTYIIRNSKKREKRDVIRSQTEKYKKMLDSIQTYKPVEFLTKEQKRAMEEELSLLL